MDTKQALVYHIVQFLTTQDNLLSSVHCVPASWIRWQDKESTKALVAYPDESSEITSERVKIYESPGGYWNLYWAQIKYTTDFYDSTIRSVNECDRSVEESSTKKVICTEIERSNFSSSIKASLSSKKNDTNAFWPELHKWFSEQTISDEPRLSIMNKMYEVISSDSEGSDQEDVDRKENDVPLDLSVRSLYKVPYSSFRTSSDTDESWTLKHREYKPGLIELMSNTGVYIGIAELNHCLINSKKRTQLGRLLTLDIFSESALKTCVYINNIKGQRDLRLSTNATTAIVKFVQMYGDLCNWDKASMYEIKNAMRYQLGLCKREH